jgi:serine/threonine-protein kinase
VDQLRGGSVLGERYRLIEHARAVSPGTVWRAIDQMTGREVAVKALGAFPANDQTSWARARLTLRVIVGLQYPGIAQAHDYGQVITQAEIAVPYLVRDFVRGPTLEQRLAEGPLGVTEALEIVACVADALAAVHQAGLVHGNVVPANVVLGASGARVTDAGLWVLRDHPAEKLFPSALSYAAPERAAGAPATPATDIYSLGVVFVACLTGIVAGGGTGTPPLPELSGGMVAASLASLWAACLGASPWDRPSAAHAAVMSRQLISSSAAQTAAQAAAEAIGETGDPEPDASYPGASYPGDLPVPPRLTLHPGPAEPDDVAQPAGTGAQPAGAGAQPAGAGMPGGRRPAGEGRGRGAHQEPGQGPVRPGAGRRRQLRRGGGLRSRGPGGRVLARADARLGWGRRGGLLALGGAATGVTVAVMVVLAQFLSPSAPANSPSVASSARSHEGSSASPSPPTPRPGASAEATSSVPAVRRSRTTPLDAIDQLWRSVHHGAADGQIRPDVAQDFENLIGPVRTQLIADEPAQVASLVPALRLKLATRLGEGAISTAAARTLGDELTRLSDSVKHH